jgi:hypothetical protein
MLNRRAVCFTLVVLAGCADVNWERAFYQGQRNTAEQCRLTRRPADPPCPVLPEYGQYEKERARAMGIAASDVARPVETQQR